MEWRPYIHSDREIQGGKPVLRGTRLTIEFILGLFANGWSPEQILQNYPQMTADSLKAVFAFAADTIEDESFVLLKRDAI